MSILLPQFIIGDMHINLPSYRLFCFEAINANSFLALMRIKTFAQALHYDIRRGPHSVGSHVRDAAAYVCWAFGRAYYHRDMEGVLKQLAPHLLTVACYDREVVILHLLTLSSSAFYFFRISSVFIVVIAVIVIVKCNA